MITNFSELLDMAREQQDAQRLLFLFASTKVNRKSRKSDEQKGEINPTMCVDKLPEELTNFKALSAEADSVSKDWDMVFIAALAGENNQAPSSDDAEPFLNKMTSDIKTGQDLSRYVVFDRDENPIVIQAA